MMPARQVASICSERRSSHALVATDLVVMCEKSIATRSSTLVLLRHGSSVANEGQCFGGWDDVVLSERGIEQARSAGRLLKQMNLHFDLSFTSVLRRAIWTLWHCLDALDQRGTRTTSDWRLNERHYGNLQGMKKSEAAGLYSEELVRSWRRSFRQRPPQLEPGDPRDSFGIPPYEGLSRSRVPLGESLQDTQQRVCECWDELILPALKQGQNLLLVAHGNSIRALLMELECITEDEIAAVEVPNGVPIVYDRQPGDHHFVRRQIIP